MSRFNLRIGERSVGIPPEAYVELANPSLLGGLSIIRTRDELAISIKGGDGEAGFTARFIAVNGELLRRELSELDADGERVTSIRQFVH